MFSRPMASVVLTILVLAAELPAARADWSLGFHFNLPGGSCRPHCGYRPYYYRPYPVYVRPAPIVVQPVEVIPSIQPAYRASPMATRPPVSSGREADIQAHLHRVQHPDERERSEALLQLGRLRAYQAVPVVTGSLTNDRSPVVREAAARALGLIGTDQSLPALQQAAQADPDREVRRSSAYAVDVIRANLTHR